MYTKFLLDFIPWIFFATIAHWLGPMYASIIMIIWISIVARQQLKKRFILDWGGLIFFILMLISTIPGLNLPKLYTHPSLWSNLGLTIIMWTSLIINKPFTLQYAKDKAPKKAHNMLIFKKINLYMTIIWCLLMMIITMMSLAHVIFGWKGEMSSVISIIAIIAAIKMNALFPKWFVGFDYRRKLKNLPPVDSPYLRDNFAPIHNEIYQKDLFVTGTVPVDLDGIYMRNGPNPAFDPITYNYPFDGDGMVHAVYFKNGHVAYRNRFIETKGLLNEKAIGRALYPGVSLPISPDPKLLTIYPEERRRNGAFIKVIQHADKLLATLEANAEVYEITKDLKTVGVWKQKGNSEITINAHAHIDPDSGELIAVNYNGSNEMNIVIMDNKGHVTREFNLKKKYSSVIHDFVITKNYIVVFDCPATFNLDALNNEKFDKLLQWQPELGSQLMVISRDTGELVKQYNVPAFWVYHFANGYEQNDNIIIDYMRAERFVLDDQDFYAHLDRYILNLTSDLVQRHELGNHNSEFPRVNENYFTKMHQYIYLLDFSDGLTSHALIKHDVKNNHRDIREFGTDVEIDEPQFVPKNNASTEDEGYLLMFVYYRLSQTSTLLILDAQNINAKPIAEINLPQRVPHGLHGNWIV